MAVLHRSLKNSGRLLSEKVQHPRSFGGSPSIVSIRMKRQIVVKGGIVEMTREDIESIFGISI